jgi:hypothetical protein
MTDAVNNVIPFNTPEITNRIVVALNGDDEYIRYEDYGLTFDSSEQEILTAIEPRITERFSVSLRNGNSWLYKTTKTIASQNIYVIPNSTAG